MAATIRPGGEASILPPPDDIGRRLLPSVVDEIASTDPDRVIYSVTETKNPADGFQDVTARQLACAVDRCAHFLDKSLGSSEGKDFPTLMYMGPQDVIYAILVLASIKAGYKVLLTSPRNTLEAHLSLLEETDCRTFMMPPVFPLPVVKQILDARPMQVLHIQGLHYWISDQEGESNEAYPYEKSYEAARGEPFVVLHTSGSTGRPKPIVQTHGTISALDAFRAGGSSMGLKPVHYTTCVGKRIYLGFPLFHCAGISMLLPGAIFLGFTIVLGPFPPSPDVVNAIHTHGNVQESCIAPMTIIDLVKDEAHLQNLSRLDTITYGGGPLPHQVGSLVSTKTRILNVLGTTECGVLPVQLCDPDDWEYLTYSPILGHEFRPVSDGLYEHVIVRQAGDLELYQGVFSTFPELQEWPMKDLYSPHPTNKDAWLYRGRSDDIVVFSTGEKLNPLDMEATIGKHPSVKAALVGGHGQFQSSLLVEPADGKAPTTHEEKALFLDELWPSVEAANRESPSHARIHREMIILATDDKPFPRAGKGTVQRKMTMQLYNGELNDLYEASERHQGRQNPKVDADLQSEESVHSLIAATMGIDASSLDATSDLFELGLDSLQVTVIAKAINHSLSASGAAPAATIRTVYSNPTVVALTKAKTALAGANSSPNGGLSLQTLSDEEKMQKLYDAVSQQLPVSGRKPQPRPANERVVLLTGATGSLGSYILDSLISDRGIKHVYCLSRGPNSHERQQSSQAAKGLQPLPSDRVTHFDADVSKPYFGIPLAQYTELLTSVTDIVHNAWRVDFNLSLDSFSSQVHAVRHLIDFSSHSTYGAQVLFVSSISAVGNMDGVTAEERVYNEWTASDGTGYGQSKLIAERLLDAAARDAGIPCTICRVGQIAGPRGSAGKWPEREWLPTLVKSSRALGKLPQSLGMLHTVDWVPVDVVGKVIVELMTASIPEIAEPSSAAVVYHVANPSPTSWSEYVEGISRLLGGTKGPLEQVPLESWLELVRTSGRDPAEVPAVKLLDFFSENARSDKRVLLDTIKTRSQCKALADVGPIRAEWIENWIRQWGYSCSPGYTLIVCTPYACKDKSTYNMKRSM